MDEQKKEEKKNEAADVQSQINDLKSKAEHASGQEKQGLMQRIQELGKRKDNIMGKIKDYEAKAGSLEGDTKKIIGDLGM